MTPKQRKAMEQALEALDNGLPEVRVAASAALCAALAEQPAEQEPVAYVCPSSRVTADGSMEDGPDYLEWADEAGDYEKRVGAPLYTAPQPAIPPGYKLVPVGPTPEMKTAGIAVEVYPESKPEIGALTWAEVKAIYSAMLAAAPEAPKPAKQPLTDEEIYECGRLAAIRHQRHKHSIRGQQITPADDPQWHFARAVIAAYDAKNGITGETK